MNLTGTLHKNGVILHEIFDKSENNFTLLPQLPDCVTKPKRRVFLLLTNLTTHPRVLPQILPYFCDPCRNSTVMFDKVLRHHGCIGLYHSVEWYPSTWDAYLYIDMWHSVSTVLSAREYTLLSLVSTTRKVTTITFERSRITIAYPIPVICRVSWL